MTYKTKNGKQFVVIAAGGHWAMGTPASDHLIAFALPDSQDFNEVYCFPIFIYLFGI